jgi:hypothetical protein
MRPLVAVVVSLALVVACGSTPPGRTPSGGYISCSSDAECVVTTFSGCCACCPGEPRAVPSAKLEAQQNRCAAAGCPACSDRLECPKASPVASFVAKCNDGTCAAVPK